MRKTKAAIGLLAAVSLLFVGIAPASAKPNAYVAKWGKFATQTYSGVGDDVIRLPKAVKAFITEASHDGEANFIVTARTGGGSYNHLLFNEIGYYSGVTAEGFRDWDSKTRVLEVEADGAWTLVIKPINRAKKFETSGFGSAVMKYKDGFKTWRINHTGESNFIIWQYCTKGMPKLVVNEIGNYSGRKNLRKGKCVIVLYGDGEWSFSS
jgi:hypothetical protein